MFFNVYIRLTIYPEIKPVEKTHVAQVIMDTGDHNLPPPPQPTSKDVTPEDVKRVMLNVSKTKVIYSLATIFCRLKYSQSDIVYFFFLFFLRIKKILHYS